MCVGLPSILAQVQRQPQRADVVFVAHPRTEADVRTVFGARAPALDADVREFLRAIPPLFGAFAQAGAQRVGFLFLPLLASQILDPRRRIECRQLLEHDALDLARAAGARHVTLGGLTGALSSYGRRLQPRADALGMSITTGHSMTAVCVARQWDQCVEQLQLPVDRTSLAVVGVGSIGAAVTRLLALGATRCRPRRLVLVDATERLATLRTLSALVSHRLGIPVEIETVARRAPLPPGSAAFGADVIVTAVSTPAVIDPRFVRSGTVLIDDSQPHAWERGPLLQRCLERADVAPCDAGVIDVGRLGYSATFPFDFNAGARPTALAWSCLAEGLARSHDPDLPRTVGEPDDGALRTYWQAFDRLGFALPPMHCQGRPLDVAALRAGFAARGR